MLTPQRKNHQRRINKRSEWRDLCNNYVRYAGWRNRTGLGRYWKRKLSKARRRYAKDILRGLRGKEPVNLEGRVNWRST